MFDLFSGGFVILFVIVIGVLATSIRILNEYERGVIFRLGRIQGAKGPGLIILIPIIDKMFRVDLRTVTLDVPAQDAITKDNVTVKVNAVVYFKVIDPSRAFVEVENYLLATSKLAQTTLRSVIGQVEMDELLSSRDEINRKLQGILDAQTEPWGVKVSNVEVKQIDLPVEMQRAMARQAEAERERRAKVIAAEGEFEASKKLSEAAEIINKTPMTLQLRYLQTMVEISSERNTTTFFPFPMEMVQSLFSKKS
jgi:regulator of protease activity HflC (stomatin/prohibitin superfamily)